MLTIPKPFGGLVIPRARAAGGLPDVFPVIEGTNTSAQVGTSVSVALPSGIQAGDVLVVMFSNNGTTNITPNTPSGWSSVFSGTNGNLRFTVFVRQANGTEGGTLSVTLPNQANTAHNTYRISGAGVGIEASSAATGASGSANPPSLSPSWGVAKTLWLAAVGQVASEGLPAPTPPTNYSDTIVVSSSSIFGSAACFSARRFLEASSDDPGSFTVVFPSAWVAATIAIPPG